MRKQPVRIIIHRGARQIGGCITEIATQHNSVFVDVGENLPGNNTIMPLVEGLTAGSTANRALLLTHYHGDHIGRLVDVLPEVPVYMGKTAKTLQMNLTERMNPKRLTLFGCIQTFTPLDRIKVGADITIMPLMIDHSAFDAYMFVIEAGGTRILHTGDFRLHGVRGGKTLKMLNCYARDIDYVICEGTTLSRVDEPPFTEHELRRKAAELMKTAEYVFVMCSSTNIDRIGAFYHANPVGRLFICDEYQKTQLEAVRLGHSDKSSFYDFRHVISYARNIDTRMKEKGFCMLIRQGEFFRTVMEKYKDNCLVIYSMWTGYLDGRAKNDALRAFMSPYRYRVLHTSGHAQPNDIKKIYGIVKPKCGLIPIHTESPEAFNGLLPDGKIIVLNDKETLCIR
jgi:ribonuclease J